jgi:hypothetical protein
MQNEITKETKLLDTRGNIAEPGWARKSLYRYDRGLIKAPAFRVKEWDYYCIMSSERGLALTVADNGYMGFYGITLFDFTNCTEVSGTVMTVLPLGKLNLPSSSNSGDIKVYDKSITMTFVLEGSTRVLRVDYPAFNKGAGLNAEIQLQDNPDSDRMVIATPFNKQGHFYFNEKHNCLPAQGKVNCGDLSCEFGPGSYGVLDWGRGVWTYKNTWYWGSASGEVDGVSFGFNIGYGFGDTSAATENMLFYKGHSHKLTDIVFNIPLDADGAELYMEPWTFSSSDGRFEMDFITIIDRHSDTNVLIIRSAQHQVFGHFTGKAVLDDGTVIELKNFLGFAEKVFNRW